MSDNTPYVVVVGFELSPPSEIALEQAIALIQGRGEDCQLHVLAVLDEHRGLLGFVDGKPDFAGAERTQAALRTIVDKKLLEVRSQPINLYLHARIGVPAKEIVELAEEVEADL